MRNEPYLSDGTADGANITIVNGLYTGHSIASL
jgi:hypothetical protein